MYSAITQRHSHLTAAEYGWVSGAVVEGIDCDRRRRPAYNYAIEESEWDALAAEAAAARQRRSLWSCHRRTSGDLHICER
jgi:hypothetical protein